MNYSEKLKDPRWQKKRLEVLQRDNFACQHCEDKETSLHIHHTYYEFGKDIWDYEKESLITLCETCHYEHTRAVKHIKHNLKNIYSYWLYELEDIVLYCSKMNPNELRQVSKFCQKILK
jgi:5-methylcytosine-specific restriction endonuclease McrA